VFIVAVVYVVMTQSGNFCIQPRRPETKFGARGHFVTIKFRKAAFSCFTQIII